MTPSVEKFPINLELWRLSCTWITELDALRGKPRSGKQFKIAVEDHYRWLIQDAKSEADIKDIVRWNKKMGYIPKIPNRKKRSV